MRTDHTKFSLSTTPTAFVRAVKLGEIGAQTATVQSLARLLTAHADPMVQAAINGLLEFCINPWIETQKVALEEGLEINADEHYDLVLPTLAEGEDAVRLLLGSSSDCAVRLAAVENVAGAVRGTRKEDGTTGWMLELFREQPPVHLNGKELEVVQERYATVRNDFELKAGDEIRVGHHVIHVLEAE